MTKHQRVASTYLVGMQEFYVEIYDELLARDGLRTPNEGINQRNLKIWAEEADKIFFGHT